MGYEWISIVIPSWEVRKLQHRGVINRGGLIDE